MKWFSLTANDQRYNNWVLYRELQDEGPLLRDRYHQYACPSCGKCDEYSAVRSGIDIDVIIRTNTDIVSTTDDIFTCISDKAYSVIETHRITGLDFVSLPDRRFHIALPNSFIDVDIQKSGMQFYRQCMLCGRFEETTGGPGLAALGVTESPEQILLRNSQPPPLYRVSTAIPDDPLQVFSPRVFSEGAMGRSITICISEEVVRIFKAAKLTGGHYFQLA